MQLHALKEELLPVLLACIPTIITQHATDMMAQGGECERYFVNHADMIHTSLTVLLEEGLRSLFLDEPSFEQYKQQLVHLSYDEGKQDALHEKMDNIVVLEANHNLRLHFFNCIIPAMDTKLLDPKQKFFCISRFNDTASLRFKSYYLGYISEKDQQIDKLHQQKIAVMGQMAAGMAHEIRNPLTSIKGFLHLMKEAVQKQEIHPDQFISYFDICRDELEVIEELVTNFLILARKDKVSRKEIIPVNLISILQRVEDLAKHFAFEKAVTLAFHYHESTCLVLGIASHIEQICLNIIKNGIDAVPVGGSSVVKTFIEEGNKQVVIQFVDNGPGIPPEERKLLFEPFFTTKSTGTGMGLPICRQLVTGMGGSIEIHSVVGEGTIVEVRLSLCNTE